MSEQQCTCECKLHNNKFPVRSETEALRFRTAQLEKVVKRLIMAMDGIDDLDVNMSQGDVKMMNNFGQYVEMMTEPDLPKDERAFA